MNIFMADDTTSKLQINAAADLLYLNSRQYSSQENESKSPHFWSFIRVQRHHQIDFHSVSAVARQQNVLVHVFFLEIEGIKKK